MLTGRNIVLGVTGSVAAYKAIYLTRLLTEAGAEVWPILTPSATRFVGALSFSALSGHRAVTDLWSSAEAGEIGHVELAHRADAFVVAPATADVLARLALGRADEPLTAVALSTRAPWIIAPAMEDGMWTHDATQGHVTTLMRRGARFVAPTAGALASGRSGQGRLADPEDIVEAIRGALTPQDLAGDTVLVTAGPTRELIDPARFVSNPSTGKMGYALARAAKRRGARVVLVSGPTTLAAPTGVELVRVTSTDEMLAACQAHLDAATLLFMAAAPADFRPAAYSPTKAKKQEASTSLELMRTPDILKTLMPRQDGRRFVVGFAAESHELEQYARQKLLDKDLDLIVANDITRPDAGFAADTNAVTVFGRDGTATGLPFGTKDQVAEAILTRVLLLRGRS